MKKIILFLLPVLLAACGSNQNQTQNSTSDSTGAAMSSDTSIIQTAKEAYIFGLPLVLMDISRRQATSANSTSAFHAPANQFVNLSQFPDATFRAVVRAGQKNNGH
jgi:hypothetical protein